MHTNSIQPLRCYHGSVPRKLNGYTLVNILYLLQHVVQPINLRAKIKNTYVHFIFYSSSIAYLPNYCINTSLLDEASIENGWIFHNHHAWQKDG